MRFSRIRGLTVTGGVVLGGLVLLVTGVLGVIDKDGSGPAPHPEATRGHTGPLTGVQPALERALLSGNDLRPTQAAASYGPASTGPASRAAMPEPGPVPAEVEAPEDTDDCRALFEDPTGLAAMWPAATPRETSTRDTTGEGGSVLRQVLGVFDEETAELAYARLRETVAGCDEFTALLSGVPVQVLVEDLNGAQREEGYDAGVTVLGEGERLVGWLAMDRIGPVISVLRHLRPEGAPTASTPTETRRTALDKLRPLLRFLDRDGRGAR